MDIDHAGVGFRQCADLFQGQCVDLSNECYPLVTRFGQSDEFFEPSRSGRFDMQACSAFGQGLADNRIDRKFVAPAMDAEFEVAR